MAAAEEIIKLAARVAFQQLGSPYRAALERRIGGVVACGALAIIVGLAGIGCGVAALWLWLSPILGSAEAALVATAVLLLAAFILGFATAQFARRSPSPALPDLLDAKAIGDLAQKHIPELVIAAAIGGLVLGLRRRSPPK
ncbi:MAG TPA: hypothetical protein VNF99_02305 [Stellaceae bacterium]|nr:hypothetical protein [Stellaceae bacterium]